MGAWAAKHTEFDDNEEHTEIDDNGEHTEIDDNEYLAYTNVLWSDISLIDERSHVYSHHLDYREEYENLLLQNEAPSSTTLYDLPLEVMDNILQKSYLHWLLKSSTKHRDEEVMKSLVSVDVCFYRRITRQRRFKKAIWRYLEDFYGKTKKTYAIIRNNRNYLLENILPNDELIDFLFSLNCITIEERHFIQRQRSIQDKNAELLHVVGSFDDKKFSTFVKCLRQTNQTAVARIVKIGGVVIKVEARNCGTAYTALMDPQLFHQRISDLRTRTKSGSHQTDELVHQLKEDEIELLNCQLDRQTVVVWIWCRSQAALEYIETMYESNQLRDVFFGFENNRPSTFENIDAIVINIDQNQLKKAVVVVFPVSVSLTERINVGRNETAVGVTKLRNEIYVLCQSFPPVIHVFEGRNPFRLQMKIEINVIEDFKDIGSSEKESCLYVSDQREKCIWKITRQTDYQHEIIKWLTIDYAPHALSVSSNGHLLLVTSWSPILNIYGSDAVLLRSIQLPRDIENSIHVVETSIGNFIILHQWMENEERESGPSGRIKERICVVSELTRDGQMVIHRFIPSNETQKLKDPRYLSLDSEDQVFVADTGNDRMILLDSDLTWNRILCSLTEEEELEEETMIRKPLRLCYDERKKQLIVAGGYFYFGGFNIYTLCQK